MSLKKEKKKKKLHVPKIKVKEQHPLKKGQKGGGGGGGKGVQTKKQNTRLLGWKTPQWDYEAIVTKAELGFVRLEIELRDRERVSECVCVTERE